MENENKKPNRKGVFVGGYVPLHLKEFLTQQAKARHKTVSYILKEILIKEIGVEFVTRNTSPIQERGVRLTCKICSIKFVVGIEFKRQRRRDKGSYYCPNGHKHVYDQTEEEG
jgi:hypothetical protein